MQNLSQRIALALQWGWPTMEQRRSVVVDSQEAQQFSDLSDESQRLILNWERSPRRSPIGEVDTGLRDFIRKARAS